MKKLQNKSQEEICPTQHEKVTNIIQDVNLYSKNQTSFPCKNKAAVMRTRFLQFCHKVTVEPHEAQFTMRNKLKVSGSLCGTNDSQDTFFISKLETPLGTYPYATLRAPDIMFIDIEL